MKSEKKKKQNKNHDAPAQSLSSYVAYMYISGRPSHFTAKRNIAFTIYHHLPRIFFFKIQSSIDPSVSSSSEKKKSFQPIAILALKHSHSRSYMLFLFVSRVCSMVMPFFILLCLSCRYHHVSAREMIKEAMRSWKKKKKERGKKKTRVQRFDGNGIEWSGITEIAMIVSFVDSFIIDWLLLLLQIILLRVPHLNDEQSYYDYRIIFFSFPPSLLIFLLFSFLGACRTMYSRCQR